MRKEPETLRDAYLLYKENKYLRQDMIGRIVTEIEALQARIGSVDEAAVASLDNRVGSLETVLGAALRQPPALKSDAPRGWPKGKSRKKSAQPPAPMNEMGV